LARHERGSFRKRRRAELGLTPPSSLALAAARNVAPKRTPTMRSMLLPRTGSRAACTPPGLARTHIGTFEPGRPITHPAGRHASLRPSRAAPLVTPPVRPRAVVELIAMAQHHGIPSPPCADHWSDLHQACGKAHLGLARRSTQRATTTGAGRPSTRRVWGARCNPWGARCNPQRR